MARTTERVTIGDAQYIITQLGAVEGRGLFKKFVTAIGPLLRDVVSGPLLAEMKRTIEGLSMPDGADAEQAAAKSEEMALRALQLLVPVILQAIENLPEELFEEMCITFGRHSQVGIGRLTSGKQPMLSLAEDAIFDQHFAGDYVAMTQWLAHCVKVNGFLGKLGAKKAPAQVEATA